MASPESSRIGGARPITGGGGGGVKNLLAMFEKGGKVASPVPSPALSREVSPGPKPLGKVRTSFVAIGGKEGQAGFGLQKIPISPQDLGSPINSAFGSLLVKELPPPKSTNSDIKIENLKESEHPPKKAVEPAANSELEASKTKNLSVLKLNVPKTTPQVDARPVSQQNIRKKQETKKTDLKTQPKGPSKKNELTKKAVKVDIKKENPTSKEPSKEKTTTKAFFNKAQSQLVTKTTQSTTTKNTVNTKKLVSTSTKNTEKSSKEQVLRRKPSTAALSNFSKPKSTISTTPSVTKPASKSRQPVVTAIKKKTPIFQKPIAKPEARETTKPVALRGSAFAPTASWVAKLGPDQPDSYHRAPSVSSNPRARSPAGHVIRRKNSTISDHSRNATRSPVQNIPPPPSNDFLTRMMRPTKSSANKVHEKAEIRSYSPPFRAGSAMEKRNESPPVSPPRKTVRPFSSHRKNFDVSESHHTVASSPSRFKVEYSNQSEELRNYTQSQNEQTNNLIKSQAQAVVFETENGIHDEVGGEISYEAVLSPIRDDEEQMQLAYNTIPDLVNDVEEGTQMNYENDHSHEYNGASHCGTENGQELEYEQEYEESRDQDHQDHDEYHHHDQQYEQDYEHDEDGNLVQHNGEAQDLIYDDYLESEVLQNGEQNDVDLTINITDTKHEDGSEEGHTPTTTSSSTTLVHEGEALEIAKVQE